MTDNSDRTSDVLSNVGAGLVIVSGLLYFVGLVSAFVGGYLLLTTYTIKGSTWPIIGGAALAAGLFVAFVGWMVNIIADRLMIEAESLRRLRQIAAAAMEIRDDARKANGQLELQLRTIAANTARTAQAVEVLSSAVKRSA